MKRFTTLFAAAAFTLSAMATDVYSWASPDGTVVETGGTMVQKEGKDTRLNYSNAGNYTICLNGKKANINDADGSDNACHMELTLDEPLQAGDIVELYGYINKNDASKSGSAYLAFKNDAGTTVAEVSESTSYPNIDPVVGDQPDTHAINVPTEAVGCKTIWFTRNLAGTNVFILTAKVTRADDNDSPFGEGELAAPTAIWPAKNGTMAPTAGNVTLKYDVDVNVFGTATVGGKEVALSVADNVVTIPYEAAADTEVTVTIPAGAIGNDDAANAELTYTFKTQPADVLFYSDFNYYPYEYFDSFFNPADNVSFIPKDATDITYKVGGMTFYSGVKGRALAMKNNDMSTEVGADYGPDTEADAGASPRPTQLSGGGKELYFETPEFEGPAEITYYIANPDGKNEFTLLITDERGKDLEDYLLAELTIGAAKHMYKRTVSYPYKGKAKVRLYNNANKVNIYDVIIVKGDGEGIDRPVVEDTDAPKVLKTWPSAAPYAPVEGTVTVVYNEPVTVAAKAQLNGADLDVEVDGTTLTVAYSGLEKGKEYTMTIPAVADEAGNATEPMTVAINTVAANVVYYTDFAAYPYAYYELFNDIPNAAGDNEDIFAKNTSGQTKEIAGITYYSGDNGRIIAMGKANQLGGAVTGASDRCIQIQGGEGGLYLQFPEAPATATVLLYVGNYAESIGNIVLTDATGNTQTPLATFTLPGAKEMCQFAYVYKGTAPTALRLYNMANNINLNDVIIYEGEVEIEDPDSALESIEAADVEAVYYNLQGVRVENPSNGLYIRKQGNTVTKVIVK
ncbi:MAG: hypothetical protein J1E29_05845 [Duncaniella sp.]|nr:hypothetical protein [Duncaniella sp.]